MKSSGMDSEAVEARDRPYAAEMSFIISVLKRFPNGFLEILVTNSYC